MIGRTLAPSGFSEEKAGGKASVGLAASACERGLIVKAPREAAAVPCRKRRRDGFQVGGGDGIRMSGRGLSGGATLCQVRRLREVSPLRDGQTRSESTAVVGPGVCGALAPDVKSYGCPVVWQAPGKKTSMIIS